MLRHRRCGLHLRGVLLVFGLQVDVARAVYLPISVPAAFRAHPVPFFPSHGAVTSLFWYTLGDSTS